jgi:hypothetical protein
LRTLAAIFVIALPAGWAAFAATQSPTDTKATSKTSTAKKTTSTKTSSAKTSTGKTSTKSTAVTSSTSKTGAKTGTISATTGTKSATTKSATTAKTGVSNPKQAASKAGTSTGSRSNAKQQTSTRYRRSSQQVPSADRYQEIQQALVDKGYFAGPADGTWGASSQEALKRFQHDQSLTEDGRLGSLSIIALGLGPKRGGISPLASPARQPEPSLVAPEPTADAPTTDPTSDPQ